MTDEALNALFGKADYSHMFYVGLDVALGAMAEAWEDFKQAKIEAKMAAEAQQQG